VKLRDKLQRLINAYDEGAIDEQKLFAMVQIALIGQAEFSIHMEYARLVYSNGKPS